MSAGTVADPNHYTLVTGLTPDHHGIVNGEHGYDNAAPGMRALFVAHGPAFVCGLELKPFPNVDVYPLLAYLLHIPPLPNDGDLAPLRRALRDTAPRSDAARCPASAIRPKSR